LYLSPYIFQKPEKGDSIAILAVGNEIIAYNVTKNESADISCGLQERLLSLKNELNMQIVLFLSVYNRGRYYFYLLNQVPDFNELTVLFKDKFEALLTNYLIKEYNS
ncbi:MAG: hypothetical protein LUG16_07380, partial [Candidatus Gastranaerophilales bacterium]|nr:hypothetical protein [Candidatus Gastranaerophilales bacterium]